jgi:protoheme IX farnesyltransferase
MLPFKKERTSNAPIDNPGFAPFMPPVTLTPRKTERDTRLALLAAALLLYAGIILMRLAQAAGWRAAWTPPLLLSLTLIALGVLLVPITLSFYPPTTDHYPLATTHAIFPLTVLASVFVSLVTGSALTVSSHPTGLPHRFTVGISGLLLAAFVIHTWRTRRQATPLLVSVSTAGVLFCAQSLVGWMLLDPSARLGILGLHQATAVGVWIALVVALVANTLAEPQFETGALKLNAGFWRPGLPKDFLALTKPIVVALLLVTTYAGMVIGARAWPSLPLALVTLLGGALAAGGSGAINQYIDRRDDARMQRTQRRPLPTGRLSPGEALAFGLTICLASLYLMLVFVNWLAALLTLAGILYYVLVYSLLLKKTTVQNIVIGGGAGAIPPLVGWAAATGGINLSAVLLFILVFLWTPPHFWALAIVRRKDYARAGVPMLPVVRGLARTRGQIFLYSLELVAFTLLMPLLGLGGLPYLAGAALLGAGLLRAAWRVWRRGGNKRAWMMYRYSSLYLAGVFLALMIDALI